MTYTERRKACKLATLHYKHIRGDMIEMYKILSGKYDTAVIPRVNREYSSITRVNDLRLQKTRVKYDLWKYYFTNNRAVRHLTFGTVYLTMLFCPIKLIR